MGKDFINLLSAIAICISSFMLGYCVAQYFIVKAYRTVNAAMEERFQRVMALLHNGFDKEEILRIFNPKED